MEKPLNEPRARADLIAEVKRLQAARQSHLDALRAIDEVLAGVARTLAATGADVLVHGQVTDVTGRSPAGSSSNPLLTADFPPAGFFGMRRRYQRLPQTGEDFVLSFVRDQGAPTTLEINEAWRAQGRGGAANNVIGRLLKQGLLIREPIGERRGSRYRLSSAPAPEANA